MDEAKAGMIRFLSRIDERTAKMARNDMDLDVIGDALDKLSWEWLCENHEPLAQALEVGVAQGGASPDKVRRYVMAHTQRYELALRCEQAARFLLTAFGRR